MDRLSQELLLDIIRALADDMRESRICPDVTVLSLTDWHAGSCRIDMFDFTVSFDLLENMMMKCLSQLHGMRCWVREKDIDNTVIPTKTSTFKHVKFLQNRKILGVNCMDTFTESFLFQVQHNFELLHFYYKSGISFLFKCFLSLTTPSSEWPRKWWVWNIGYWIYR